MATASLREPPQAPLRVAVGFWLALGILSTASAEVVTGSTPFPFLSAWGLAVVLPLYGLHAVVLAAVVRRLSGTLRWWPLFLAGGLFGLYEAYVTKVLWVPTWDALPFRVGGVAVVESVLLVLFWHPLASFVIPLFAAERLLARSRLVGADAPAPLRHALASPRRRTVVLLGLAAGAGAFQGSLAPSPGLAVASAAAALATVGAVVLAWRRRIGPGAYDLPALLPRGRRLAVLALALAALYVVLGVTLRTEALPAARGRLTVLGGYVVLGGLLVAGERRSRPPPAPIPDLALDPRRVAVGAGVYVGFAAAVSAVGPLRILVLVGVVAAAVVVGPLLLALAARDALGR